jgi:glutamate N-acetyltransferase/amino-acid N-acetyltransferase
VGDVVVCSTGLIGEQLDLGKLTAGVREAAAELASASPDGGRLAAEAIMTTDTHPKEAVHRAPEGWTIGGMAKGAGMLAPGLATMLVVITTDVDLPSERLDAALRAACHITFDRLDSDGCMSTNDTVVLLASGASGLAPSDEEFTVALSAVCRDLALQLQDDAEGASHNIAIAVRGAVTEDEAVEVGRAVSRSNLFKAAIFGNDPNWGRVLAAVGTTSAEFDPYGIDVAINGVQVCTAGEPDQPRTLVDLTPRDVRIDIDLHAGEATATILTNDLTHDYVHENSAYAS